MGVTQTLSKFLALPLRPVARLQRRERANRVSPTLSNMWDRELGVGQDRMPLT